MNKVFLIGRLTKDPETRQAGETSVCRFGIAVDRKYKKEGEPTADFLNCVAFGKTADFIVRYFRKGKGIVLEGHIQTGNYTDKDGKKVYTTDIIVDGVEFYGSAKEDAENGGNRPAAPVDNDGFMHMPDALEDSELPFN